MNDYSYLTPRDRKKTLIVTEGKLEKQQLMLLILTCFPEININYNDIYTYETNIYNLYNDIVAEYGNDWDESNDEINLLLLLKRKQVHNSELDEELRGRYEKKNYTNIILTFDYEHHDSFFSDEKIIKMQKHFDNISEDGILLINYPMIESYLHFETIPDEKYLAKNIPITCNPGKEYKKKVREESGIINCFDAFDNLRNSLCGKK